MKKALLIFLIQTLIATFVLAQSNLTDSLIAFYPFNGNANDVSGHQYHAISYGPTLTTDRFNRPNSAYLFNGVSDYIKLPSSFDMQQRSVSIWFYPTNITSENSRLYDSDNANLKYGNCVFWTKFENGTKNFNMAAQGGSSYNPQNIYNYKIVENVWNHAVIVIDGLHVCYYLNGELLYSFNSPYYACSSSGNNYATLGTSRLFNQYFTGKIDDVRIYNKALSNKDVLRLYDLSDDCLISDYELNTSTILDNSRFAYVGTGTDVTPAADRFGQLNSALYFNGTSSYVQLPDVYDVADKTVSIWFHTTEIDSNYREIFTYDHTQLTNGMIMVGLQKINGQDKLISAIADTRDTIDVSINKWYSLIVQKTATSAKIFIDGVIKSDKQISTNEHSLSGIKGMILGSGRLLANRFFKGTLDDFKFYECIISTDEINKLSSKQNDCFIQEYSFDSNDDSLLNAKQYSYVSDRFNNSNSALHIAGDSSYVLLPDFDFNSRTIDVWFNADSIDNNLRSIITVDHANLINGLLMVGVQMINNTPKLITGIVDSRDTIDIQTKKWNHLIITVKGNIAKLKLNDVVISKRLIRNTIKSQSGYPNLIIGAGRLLQNRFFIGAIDELKLYKCVMDDDNDCSNNASFTYELNDLYKIVSFKDNSAGSVNSWTWDFGDGSISNLKNPIHNTYYKNGIYNICLTVRDTLFGCQSQSCTSINVGGYACEAGFIYDLDFASGKVNFTDNSTGTLSMYLWDFGDGSISFAENPTHSFLNNGYYLVSLSIYSDVNNCFDFKQELIVVNKAAEDCEALFNYSVDVFNNQVSFNNQSLVSSTVDYLWDFGDGTTSTEIQPIHSYSQEGYYNVCLNLSTGACSDITCQELRVDNIEGKCNAAFGYVINTLTSTVSFIDLSTGMPNDWYWNFGDGGHSTLQNPVYTFNKTGLYQIHLNIKNQTSKCIDHENMLIDLTGKNDKIKGVFGYIEDTILRTKGVYPIEFKGCSFGDVSSVEWDFGDGSTNNSSLSPQHHYQAEGIYNVCLKVSDQKSGQVDTYCSKVDVGNTSTDIANVKADAFKYQIAPNPFKDNLTLTYQSDIENTIQYCMMDDIGKIIIEGTMPSQNGTDTHVEINTTNLAVGVYLLKLTVGSSQVFTERIIKTK